MLIWTPQNRQQYSSAPISCFWVTQVHWQGARQLQLHGLCRLNPFISCVCTFTYLSLSIIFMAGSSHSCCSVVNHAHEHVSIIPEYTEHFMVYTNLGNQGATNASENVRYIHMGAVVMINVKLAQACPNKYFRVLIHWTASILQSVINSINATTFK